jgi:cytochrome c peroxidase
LRRNLLPFWPSALLLTALALLPANSNRRNPIETKVRLTVRVRHRFADADLRFDDVSLHNGAGNTLSVSRLAYLVSNVTLQRVDGTPVALPDTTAYLNPGEGRNTFDLPAVPVGAYTGLSFQVGLPGAINHADPARYPASHPLNPLVNQLHWGWQGGYVFLAIEGRYTMPGAGSIGKLGGYSYHLGTDRNPMLVTLSHPFQVERDSVLDLNFDVARVFDAINPIRIEHRGDRDSTHSAVGDELAVALKANVARAFTLIGVTDSMDLSATPPAKVAAYPPHTTPYRLPVPAHFPQPALPLDNPLTVEGIMLGRRLLFEKRLSGNNMLSCAGCHRPERAFSDSGKATSLGIDGKRGVRRAMPLFNLAWSGRYTWDGRRALLREQALAPIQDRREMHETLPRALAKLSADATYRHLFARAFGSPGVTAERLSLAIEQYLLTLISANSKFDRALRQEATFTNQEKQGLLLFITEYDPARGRVGGDCFHCHGGNLFTDYQFKNNGLDTTFRDMGRAAVTGRAADRGKFKTPSLRNVELTGPYMHDGRYKTLEEVIEHYNTGVHRSDTLDPNIAKHPDEGLRLSASDKRALVAFLKTLTDHDALGFQPSHIIEKR